MRSAWSGWAAAAPATPVIVASRVIQQLTDRGVVERGERGVGGGVAHDGAVAVAHLDAAPDLQRHQRPAQRGAADAEVLGEPPLGREPVAGGQALGVDEVGDVVGEGLVQPRPGEPRGRAGAPRCLASRRRVTHGHRVLTIGAVAKRLGH